MNVDMWGDVFDMITMQPLHIALFHYIIVFASQQYISLLNVLMSDMRPALLGFCTLTCLT